MHTYNLYLQSVGTNIYACTTRAILSSARLPFYCDNFVTIIIYYVLQLYLSIFTQLLYLSAPYLVALLENKIIPHSLPLFPSAVIYVHDEMLITPISNVHKMNLSIS